MHVSREVDTDGEIDDRGADTGMGELPGDVSVGMGVLINVFDGTDCVTYP